jgi:predicted peptidase
MNILVGLALALSLAPAAFQERTVKVGDRERPYRVYVPADLKPDEKLPIVLFLHGAGETGRDGKEPTRVGFGPELQRHADSVRLVAVFPQVERREFWINDAAKYAMAALEAAEKEFHTDAKRVYLTGLSMGGYGTWTLASEHPEKFAAIAPVCGGVRAPGDRKAPEGDPYKATAEKVKNLPIWIFHGGFDRTVPVSESQKLRDALKEAGATRVKYTEYEGVGHNSWDKAYAEDEFWTWLLAQSSGSNGG